MSYEIWILSGANLVNRAGSMLLTFLTLYLSVEQGLSIEKAGFGVSIYGVGSLLGSYLGGHLADRFNFLKIQLTSLILNALFFIPLVFIDNYTLILINVFVLAIIAESFRPANTIAISYFSKPENQTRSYSLMRLAYNLGFAVGPSMGGIVAGYFGFDWLWILDAITCLGAAAVIYRMLGHKINEIDTNRPSKKAVGNMVGVSAYKDGDYLIFILVVALFSIAFMQLFTSIPVYFAKELGFSKQLIGVLLGLNGALVVALEMPLIYTFENKSEKRVLMALGAVSMIAAFAILLPQSTHVILPIIFIFFITLGEVLAFPFMMNIVMNRPHPSRQGQYSALYSMGFGISFIIAPALGMYLADNFGFKLTYCFFAFLSLLVAMVLYLRDFDKKI